MSKFDNLMVQTTLQFNLGLMKYMLLANYCSNFILLLFGI